MYRLLNPVLESDPCAAWLTVGDGRFGLDARYILEHGGDVVVSDISEVLLKEGVRKGLIPSYRVENAEAMTAADDQFDYVFCKEAYHHFPRPGIALYEMLRVARKAVVLIEPADEFIYESCLSIVAHLVGRLRGRTLEKYSFEESGNFVYSISRREIEKVALGLNLPLVAFKGINDAYFEGVEYEALSENGPLQAKVKRQITAADRRCRLGWRQHKVLCAAIFLCPPEGDMRQRLTRDGFSVIDIPPNPYLGG